MLANINRNRLCAAKTLRQCCYHTETGIYGHRPRPLRSALAEQQSTVAPEIVAARLRQPNIVRWVDAYRAHGHRLANVDPVNFSDYPRHTDELTLTRYGLVTSQIVSDLNGIVAIPDTAHLTIGQLQTILNDIYCNTSCSAELVHVEAEGEREWLIENFERLTQQQTVDETAKREIAELMLQSQCWDNFVATKFPTVKRYGGEGAESMLAFFRQLLLSSAEHNVTDIVLAMPHRGKLNLLTTMLKTRPAKIFRKFKGLSEFPDDAKAMCDIASHFHVSEDFMVNGKPIHLSMPHNPSHLEAVNPVSMGKTRSKQQSKCDGPFAVDSADSRSSVINVQLHGDAAFTGQGINQECLMMAGVPHFDVGGTIHMVVNNQIGFTTPAKRSRTSRYVTDLAKCIGAPIIHVNGDRPETLTRVTAMACAYRHKFGKDIFIDLNCFRRWGHNELDDPTFTNPALYQIIHNRKSIPDMYADKLMEESVLTPETVAAIKEKHMAYLSDELTNVAAYEPEAYYFRKQWTGIGQAPNAITQWDTGVDYSLLGYIGKFSVTVPPNFTVHPHLLKNHVSARLKKLNDGHKLDWATAEALAIGSLMYQGFNVRLSGEDVGRGTFSHRHAMLVDQRTNEMVVPLNALDGGGGGRLDIAHSILSEEAVLGYEYGMATDNPHNLIIWESQFGDFFNGAQIQIDAFIASGETKWMMANGLVLLLPHGYDGAASEHSSCRLERFLQLTDSKEATPDGDDVNMHVINPTTPAQYFHALRRQMLRNFRKPLIVVAPKTLLRLSDATSSFIDFQPATAFRPVIGDDYPATSPDRVRRVILCSGKHFYNLAAERRAHGDRYADVAICRLESLCPFPVDELRAELDRYQNATGFVWSQEEHRNMGAWSFVKPRFENMLGRNIVYCGRPEAATPAVGVSSWHRAEAVDVVARPFVIATK